MKINPVYVTFEQAKFLKEKGYVQKPTKLSEPYYNYNGELNGDMLEYIKSYVAKNKKDLAKYSSVAAPEQWKVVEWLRLNHGIWIDVSLSHFSKPNKLEWIFSVTYLNDCSYSHSTKSYNSPQEAYSAAFDYIPKELI